MSITQVEAPLEPLEVASTARPTARRWFTRDASGPFLLLCFFVAVPVILILVNSFNTARPGAPASYGLENWRRAGDDPQLVHAIWNTLTLGITRTLIALVLGVIIAWLLARTDMPGARQLEFLFWLAFFVPPLPRTLGWIGLLDPLYGVMNKALSALPFVGDDGSGPFNIYSFWGIVWVHVTSMSLPFMVIILTPAFRRMSADMEEAARMCGAGRTLAALRVTVPLMLPAMLGGAMLTFIYTLQSFEIELLLGSPINLDVLSTQIYRWIRYEPPQFGIATAMGVGFMTIMILVAVGYRRALRGRDYTTVGGRSYSTRPTSLGRIGRWVAFAGVSSFIVLSIVLPVGFMAIGSFMTRFGWFELTDPYTTDHWSRLLADETFKQSITTTCMFALSAAVIGVIVYWWIAHTATRSRARIAGSIDVLAWLPVAIPGMLLGLGLLWLFLGTPLRSVLYGSLAGLVIAMVINHLPTGVVQMRSALLQISAQQEEAAAMCGARRFTRYRAIMLPLLSPAIVAAAVLTITSAVRDISTVVLLASRGSTPVSLLMLEYSVSGRLETAAALGLVVTGALGVVTLLGWRLGRRAF
jgi:iron(III) transport system permease protein